MNEQHWTVTVQYDGMAHTESLTIVTHDGDPPLPMLRGRVAHAAEVAAMMVRLRHDDAKLDRSQARAYRAEHPEAAP